MRKLLTLVAVFALAACNSVYIKPNANLDKNQTIYAQRGGYSMRRSIKERLEDRGYNVVVGKAKFNRVLGIDNENWESADIDASDTMNARYIVKVSERRESFAWYWCPLNGFWWWNFNISIADQKTGQELMTWRGRGCANSSLRKLDSVLDELEQK